MILVTEANGRPGRAIIYSLSLKGDQVRAFVHKLENKLKIHCFKLIIMLTYIKIVSIIVCF